MTDGQLLVYISLNELNRLRAAAYPDDAATGMTHATYPVDWERIAGSWKAEFEKQTVQLEEAYATIDALRKKLAEERLDAESWRVLKDVTQKFRVGLGL